MEIPLYAAWTITGLLFGVGLVGTFLPILPGPTVVFFGAVLHFFLAGAEHSPGWIVYGILTVLLALSFLLEWVATAVGTRKFGGTKAGMWGAVLGGLVGIFFGPMGIFLGPVAGALVGEMVIAKREAKESGVAATGAFVGLLLGMVAKLGCSTAMIAVFLVDALA